MSDDLRLDLHVHSKYSSDSSSGLEAIAARVAEGGLRGFALTDHNTTRGHRALAELTSRYRGYLFVPGVEISTRQGHLLAFGVKSSPPTGLPLDEAIEWATAQGGAVSLPHPFRKTHGVGRYWAEHAPVPAIEGRNGHNSELANAHAELVAARRGVGVTGGSDAHHVGEVGRCVTLFPERLETVDDVVDQIQRGRCLAEGRSLTGVGRARVRLRSGLLRVGRGFKPV